MIGGLNGPQRLWIVASALLLLLMSVRVVVLWPMPDDQVIAELEAPECEHLRVMQAGAYPSQERYGSGHRCDELNAFIFNSRASIANKADYFRQLAKIRAQIASRHAVIWLVVSGCLYLIGWALGWVVVGFRRPVEQPEAASFSRSVPLAPTEPGQDSTLADPVRDWPSARRAEKPLSDLLRANFGADFPVGNGSAKRGDPLVITELRDYVAIEYAIATFLLELGECEYKFEGQRLHNLEGRIVDEITYAAKQIGESDWTQTRRFFFDITSGFQS